MLMRLETTVDWPMATGYVDNYGLIGRNNNNHNHNNNNNNSNNNNSVGRRRPAKERKSVPQLKSHKLNDGISDRSCEPA